MRVKKMRLNRNSTNFLLLVNFTPLPAKLVRLYFTKFSILVQCLWMREGADCWSDKITGTII